MTRTLLVVGPDDVEVDPAPYASGEPYETRRYARAGELAGLGDAAYHVALLCGFPETLPEPKALLAELAGVLADDGRVVAFVAPLARAAVRVAVFKGSVGENVAPLVTDEDVALYGARSIATLLEEAGFAVVPPAPGDAVVVASRAAALETDDGAAFEAGGYLFADRTPAERLAYAENELAELRAFFTTIHDNQRRLHEEAARLRGMLGAREVELDALRTETWELRRAVNPVVEDRSAYIGLIEAERDRLRETVADLEARNVRLREALAELRDRTPA